MGDDDDGEFRLECENQLLDAGGGNRIKRGTRFVHQDDAGTHRSGAGNAKTLLLAPGKGVGALSQAILHLVPKCRAAKGFFDDSIKHALVSLPQNPRAVSHIFVNAAREGIGFLEHHAHAAAELDAIHIRTVDVHALDPDAALRNLGSGDEVVHPVETTQQGGFAAS